MDNEIKLTLDPMAGMAAQSAPAPSAQPAQQEPKIPFMDESQFSEAERKAINDFSGQIDVTDSAMILGYGASAQKKISDFSDTALSNVKNKDFGEVGSMITTLIQNLQSMNDEAQEENKGFLGLFKIRSAKSKH